MVFDASRNKILPGQLLYQDRFREIEMGVAFKKIVCSHCGFPGFYKYRVQQLRRRPRVLRPLHLLRIVELVQPESVLTPHGPLPLPVAVGLRNQI